MSNEKQVRKEYKKHADESAAQKMMSFRVDAKLLPWLKSKPNKGRYINDLIARDMKDSWKLI